MSKIITIRISDDDYRDMVEHLLNRARMGKPLVGVEELLDQNALPRRRTVTGALADHIAHETMDAFSVDRYGADEWRKAARLLAVHGFTADEVEAILRSKWMRWAADAANAAYGCAKASDLRAYIETMGGDEFRRAAMLVKER